MAFYALDAGSDAQKKADVTKPSQLLGLGNVKNYLKPMTQQITLEEALELVTFVRAPNGEWLVCTVHGDCGTVEGDCMIVKGDCDCSNPACWD